MDSQILLNVNFCSEVHTNLIEKNEKSVYVRAGYSLGGLRIVPQENAGICVICMDGHIKRVYPGELEAAVCIEESCSFISVEQDLGRRSDRECDRGDHGAYREMRIVVAEEWHG